MILGTPHWLHGLSLIHIVSYGFKRVIYRTTISNVCCGIKWISKYFTKEIKIITPVLKVGTWSHRVIKWLSTATRQASGRASTRSQLCCKLAGWCFPCNTTQHQNRPIHQPWKQPYDISRMHLRNEVLGICKDRCQAENKSNSVLLF